MSRTILIIAIGFFVFSGCKQDSGEPPREPGIALRPGGDVVIGK